MSLEATAAPEQIDYPSQCSPLQQVAAHTTLAVDRDWYLSPETLVELT
jgi:hypothetical protein